MIKSDFMDKLLDGVEVEWKSLGDVAELKRGRVMSKQYLIENKGIYPVFSSQTANNGMIGSIDTFDFDGEYVNWTTDGANAGTVFYRTGKFSITNVSGLIKINNESRLNYKYLFYWLSIEAKKHVYSGMGNPKLMSNQVEKIPIPIPPLKVQEEIVRILEVFTELNAELTAELTARKKQYEYYRDKLLTFDEGQVEWKTLGEIGQFVRGNGLQKNDFAESGVGCIHYGQIYTYYGNFAYHTKSFVSPTLATKLRKAQKGDLIIATTSENIEDVCKPLVWLGEDEVCVSGETYVFKHSQNPKYLAYYLQTPMFFDYKKKNRTGTKVIRVHGDKLEKFEIAIPSLSEQARIVSILDKFHALTSSITEGLPSEIELRQKQYEYYRNMLLSFPKEEVVI
ncbi:restriction endonuclease subunit S [Aminipila sp.]|uniref:restriction endonuclease subunit S n=1 Tax=Aminipila sp. TaxID=2060095 RepID=UPI00289A0791|nr:restriction endonuclease subunit S [Aminipila sp.]